MRHRPSEGSKTRSMDRWGDGRIMRSSPPQKTAHVLHSFGQSLPQSGWSDLQAGPAMPVDRRVCQHILARHAQVPVRRHWLRPLLSRRWFGHGTLLVARSVPRRLGPGCRDRGMHVRSCLLSGGGGAHQYHSMCRDERPHALVILASWASPCARTRSACANAWRTRGARTLVYVRIGQRSRNARHGMQRPSGGMPRSPI